MYPATPPVSHCNPRPRLGKKKTPGSFFPRASPFRFSLCLHDDARGEVVHGHREVGEADGEGDQDGFHCGSPLLVWFVISSSLFLVYETSDAPEKFTSNEGI